MFAKRTFSDRISDIVTRFNGVIADLEAVKAEAESAIESNTLKIAELNAANRAHEDAYFKADRIATNTRTNILGE